MDKRMTCLKLWEKYYQSEIIDLINKCQRQLMGDKINVFCLLFYLELEIYK